MMAKFQAHLTINLQESIAWVLNVITGQTAANVIVKLRGLWFLAQIAKHKKTFKDADGDK